MDFITRHNEFNTIIGSLIAMVGGFFIMRRLSDFPGISAGSYVVVSFSITYGLIMAIFFLFRIDYSRYVYIASFGLSLLWFISIYLMVNRRSKTRFSVISGGHADGLLEIGDIGWTVLNAPEAYHPKNGAVVADLRQNYSAKWERFIADCALRGIPVYHSKQVKEALSGKVEIEHLSENNFGSLLPNMVYLHFKQFIDLVVALLFLPLFAIILVIVGSAILLTSGGPVFFRQQRMGYRGQPFMVYKFRTMSNEDSEADGNGQEFGEQENGLRASAMTRDDDGRITRLGGFLRKYR
ncbi:MAG: polyprenyl glycosylphosphotransferase, partial [Gammaproteobacteria bacterium]|nr:polyprenyl glycosylphosphotransferase [Gammaproteobacteria bacterium]